MARGLHRHGVVMYVRKKGEGNEMIYVEGEEVHKGIATKMLGELI